MVSNKEEDKRQPSDELLGILAVNVKKLRKARGFTQEDLGDACNFHPTFISMVERRKRNITINTLEVFAKVLGVEPFQLLQPGYDEKNDDCRSRGHC